MKKVIYKANSRGTGDYGWLKVNYTFSFANYFNPERMNFGALRVLNDDKIAGGFGFSKHPHDNMEIITIPLKGMIEHKDSMGNQGTIEAGEIQVMSAGTGVYHSEFNKNKNKDAEVLQIWIFPNKKNVNPRYDQVEIQNLAKENELYQILSPYAKDQGVWIHQNAWFHLANYTKRKEEIYKLHKEENGIYIFVIEGEIEINDEKLSKRDGMGIWETSEISLKNETNSKVLIMEIPMHF
ncbi:pirin family protein [Aureivirga marina]|uniref:pirin family protein n=1 Tax=Aureivirga marina TaxID=1182451 RepID=UPI0018C9DCE2|nr:pirin family protein [Aureivirga marina]